MQFFLFVLANAMLFIRPSELLPELGDLELYRYAIAACLVVSLPVVVPQLFVRCAGAPPIAGCVLGLLPAVLLSHIVHGNGDEALEQGIEFGKVLAYFLLLLGLVTTMARLRQFLCWLVLFSAAVTTIAVLRYHADLAAPSPAPANPVPRADGKNKKIHNISVTDETRDPVTGELVIVQRMCGTGIFNDPNDLALVLITAIPLCFYWLTDPGQRALRPLWVALILLFGYALMLTYSRGGFVALLAGLVTLLQIRLGGKKSLALALLLLPLLFALFAGRMTSFSASEGTGQSRIQLWSDGLMLFRQAPFFGIGMEAYQTVSYHVAHNSYIHCYAELGVLGGTLFVGAFYFALHGLYGARSGPVDIASRLTNPVAPAATSSPDAELLRLHPYLMAMLVSYAVGIAFLSRSYIVPTYLLLGLTLVYLRLRRPETLTTRCKPALIRVAAVSISFLVVSYAFVRLFVNWQ